MPSYFCAGPKGRIERFFRTCRDQFLLRKLDLSSIEKLNDQFRDWVEQEYNANVHSTLEMKPIDRFGLEQNPFDNQKATLLPHQKEIFNTIKVHAQQGGLCVIMGEPGTGKSVIKQAIIDHDPKRMITPAVARTLHTYSNTLQILCEAFGIEVNGRDTRREKLLIEAGWKVNHDGKMLVPIIDDAHLMDVGCLRKLRLLFEDFPKNHNLVLIAQPVLMHKLHLMVNEDIRSRITYSVKVQPLNPDEIIIKDHYWVCTDDGSAGNTIDFLFKIQGLSFREAMEQLCS